MNIIRTLWSDLTNELGQAAHSVTCEARPSNIGIVAGLKPLVTGTEPPYSSDYAPNGVSWASYHDNILVGDRSLVEFVKQNKIDVIIDFSDPEWFDCVLELAIRTEKPLISGTSGLSNSQMASLRTAANRIPIFRSDYISFKVKQFVDEAVEFAKTANESLILHEEFSRGKIPTEISRIVRQRIYQATGKKIDVLSSTALTPKGLSVELSIGDIRFRGPVSYLELAEDILRIAKVMAKKPAKKDGFYNLNELWDELVSYAL